MKIAVLGFSGGGKSTLARRLGERLNIPVLHLDRVHWLPGWRERRTEESIGIVAQFMEGSDWVIEGTYSKFLMERRLEEADRIVLVILPRLVCFVRATRRYFTYRGKSRPDMTPGCSEKMDWEFVRWLLWEGRTAKRQRVFDDGVVISCTAGIADERHLKQTVAVVHHVLF